MKQTIYSRCTLLMAFSFFLTSLSAKDIYLSSTGNDTNNGLTSLTSVASFSRAYAVASTGDNINVSGFIDFSIDPANTSSPKEGITISKNLTVQGTSQLTDGFDGKNLTRFFVLYGNYTLTLKALTLKNGKYTGTTGKGGGAIRLWDGTLNGENLIFDSNSVTQSGNTGIGSVLFSDIFKGISFKNCVFSNNTSEKAGVIYISATAGDNVGTRFEGCSFISNKGGSYGTGGTAIFYMTASANCSLSFINCTIAKNQVMTAGINGGTIQLQGCPATTTVNITNCTITENSTAGAMGNCSGLRTQSAFLGLLSINNSIIEGNSTTNGYDDLTINATPTTSTLMIHNSIIGRYSGTTIPTGCYPSPNKAFLTPTVLSAALGTFNTTYNCYPLLSTSPAINYGASTYLTSLTPSITTDQLGYTRPYTSGQCYSGAVEVYPVSINADANISTITVANSDITIASGKTLTVDITKSVNRITVGAGGKLTNNNGSTLTASTLNLNSDASGTATYVDNGTTVISTANVQQYLGSARNWYVSSPVSKASAPSGYTYFRYDETGSNPSPNAPATAYWVSVASAADITKGVGYIALPSTSPTTITFTTKTGEVLNSGNINISLTRSGATKTGFNLIGNPYPCHLTWTKTFVDNNASLIEPTIWYRTTTGLVNADAGWSFKTINASTGEASPLGTTNIIPPMQGFWIRALAAGTLTLNSDLIKSHQTSNPLKAPAVKNLERQRLRLQVNNGTDTDEALIYFDTDASNDLDRFDSPKYVEASSVTQIYTTVGTEKLVINGMNSIPLDTPISLGFVQGNSTLFSINANEVSNLPSDVKVILKDNFTLVETDLTNGLTSYDFSPATGIGDRFSIIFRSSSVNTGIQNKDISPISVYSNANGKIIINTNNSEGIITILNAVGQKLYTSSFSRNSKEINMDFVSGLYLVTVSVNGKVTTQKVIVK